MGPMNWLDKLIMAAIIILIAGLVLEAKADEPQAKYKLKNEHAEIVLLDAPCVQPWVKEFVQVAMPELVDRFKRAVGNFRYRSGQWKFHEGCWIEFAAGEAAAVPMIGHIWDDQTRYLEPKEKFVGGVGV